MLPWYLLENKEQPCPAELTFQGDILFISLGVFYGQKMFFSALVVGFNPTHQLPGHLLPALPTSLCPPMLTAHILRNIGYLA